VIGLTNEIRISEGLVAMDAAENQQCMTCGITRRKVFSESIVCGYELRSFFCPNCNNTIRMVCELPSKKKAEQRSAIRP
jgi:hypothetical protein